MKRRAVLLFAGCCACAAGQGLPAQEPPCIAGDSIDSDADGLGDACEYALAQRFAPTLVVRSGGCNWDDSVSPARLGGGYFFAVQTVGSHIRIAYLPAYFRDCGWSGVKCWLPWVDCSPHAGDSELVITDVRFDPADRDWKTDAIFLSAHCFGRGSDCRWYRGDELRAFSFDGDVPTIWVAEGRQANYPDQNACDRGHSGIDTCDRHDLRYRFPILSRAHNIGSMAVPLGVKGCVRGGQVGSANVQANADECFWSSETRFRGWQATGNGVTAYWRYLTEIAGFGELKRSER
ncbi:MAG: hypothetical protein WEE89_18855 [Gemmatimonadota bacterium]